MGPTDDGSATTPEPAPGRPYLPPPDIFVIPPQGGTYPVSRGAPERRLTRVNYYDRRAQLTAYEPLTETGTIKLSFRVIDDEVFEFVPGYFVGIEAEVGELKCRSPYCITSPPEAAPEFTLIVRLVPEGPLSCYLAQLTVGDVINFRGPSGKSMIPKERDTELVMMATGVGIGPFLSLAHHLLAQGFSRPIRVYWGLRQVEDVCLLDQLDDLAATYPNFSYDISLSQPTPDWGGLRGRVTESVPPLLNRLGGTHFYLVGNGAMIEEMRLALSDLGVDEQLIYRETYFNVRHRADPRVLADIRSRFVAGDLLSPFAHQEAGLFIPKRTASRRRPGAT